jgi:hypothetical protein
MGGGGGLGADGDLSAGLGAARLPKRYPVPAHALSIGEGGREKEEESRELKEAPH